MVTPKTPGGIPGSGGTSPGPISGLPKMGTGPGPTAQGSTIGELMFMFKDPDDNDASVGAEIPPDVWDMISDLILGGVKEFDEPELTTEAQRLGLLPSE